MIRRRLLVLAAVCGTAGLAFAPCQAPARAQHISSGCSEGRGIALSFDDGPNPPFTGEILDVLRARNVTATFFVEGAAAETHPEGVRALRDAGMAIGAHSYEHGTDLPQMSAGAFGADLDRVSGIIRNITGRTPDIFRPPYGHTSDTMLEVERQRGYTSVGWDLDSTDWKDSSTEDIVSAVLEGAHPGAIVLMHDGGLGGGNPDRTRTLAALPRIIDGLRAQGYTFETVPELAGLRTSDDARGARCSAN